MLLPVQFNAFMPSAGIAEYNVRAILNSNHSPHNYQQIADIFYDLIYNVAHNDSQTMAYNFDNRLIYCYTVAYLTG